VPDDRPPTSIPLGDPSARLEPESVLAEKRRLYHQMLALVTRLAEDRQSLKDEIQRHVRV
jgi:hypothetical protein